LGLPDGVDLAIDFGLVPGDEALPGDIYRVTVDGVVVHAFLSTLAFELCRDLHADWAAAAERSGNPRDVHVGLHQDPATDITLVYVASHGDEAALGREVTEALLATFAVTEFAEEVAGPAPTAETQSPRSGGRRDFG
jgi:hypothetical protein